MTQRVNSSTNGPYFIVFVENYLDLSLVDELTLNKANILMIFLVFAKRISDVLAKKSLLI